LASLSAHIALIDRDGTITDVNPAWEQFARENGGPGERCNVGANYLQVCREATGCCSEGALEVARGLEAILDGNAERFGYEYPCHSPDREHWFLLQATPLAEGKGGAVVSHTEITQRKRYEERLEQLVEERTRELREAQTELVRGERLSTLGQLAAGVAHELRTPLAVLRNSLYYLEAILDPDEHQVEEVFWEMRRAIASSDSIVGEMLDYVREPNQELSRFELREPVEEALGVLAIPPEIRLRRLDRDASVRVEAVREHLVRILTNLIQNALQAMPDGGELGIEVGRRAQEAMVSVSDSGPGVSAENLERIFDPLFSTKVWGIGLGLAISNRYAEMNQGRLEVESSPSRGATFRLLLPAI